MKKLIVPVLNNNECKEKYKDDPTFGKAIQQITEKQICAGGNQGKSLCIQRKGKFFTNLNFG